jgi:hypothetical protein
MAEKRPVIHPFLSMKKKKEIETTEREETIDRSSSNDETHDEANTNIDASVALSDDQLEEEISSSSVINQPEERQSRCELVKYVFFPKIKKKYRHSLSSLITHY